MNVLVIGASGFLGSTIAATFLRQPDNQVTGAYHTSKDKVPAGCVPISMADLETLDDKFNIVVLATGNFSLPPKELIDSNVILCDRVSRYFPSAKLIYISSVAVYGNHKDTMNENSPFNQPSFYGLSKLAGETIIQTHNRYAILRLSYLYGQNMPAVSFLPIIINKAKKERKLTLFGHGERLQDYLHVQDAADMCVAAGNYDKNAIFLGATSHSLSNLQVAKMIKAYLPDLQIEFKGDDTAPWFKFDNSQTVETLNWQGKQSFEATVQEMVS